MIATLRMAAFMMMILFAGAADLVGKLTGGAGEFGYACAIHSNKVVVGAPRANNSMGEAFVYETLLSQVARVVASDGAASDEFGSSVAIDGATFVVGAPGDNEKKGAAYVFNASTYSQTTKLTAGDDGEANDYFGSAVAIYENKIVVGAYGAFASAFDAGAAYVFDRGSLVQKLVAADSSEAAYFGRAVAIHIDWIVVGAHQDSDLGPNAGSAYVFDATTFNELSKLQASDAFNLDNFGRAVAVYADTIVVGAYLEDDLGTDAGAAYVFNAKTFDQLAKLVASDGDSNDFFGYSVSVDADAIIVGAYGDAGDKGAAYVFDTSYTQTATLSAKNGGSGDVFGWSTAISQSSIVVGAYGDDDLGSDAGAVYVYSLPPPSTKQPSASPSLPYSSSFNPSHRPSSSGPTSPRPSSSRPSPLSWDPTRLPSSSRPSASPSTFKPTRLPSSSRPSASPSTFKPTRLPSSSPSNSPSAVPTIGPSASSTSAPSPAPTASPSRRPSGVPTPQPTLSPSFAPSLTPTASPSSSPSAAPSSCPSSLPTSVPSVHPTTLPSSTPTALPTISPSASPTSVPTVPPTTVPSSSPTAAPSSCPSSLPTSMPSVHPTALPSSTPSALPTISPSSSPTSVPSVPPTTVPSSSPSAAPSSCPSSLPTSMPSVHPTALPSSTPSALPTISPSASPTSVPSVPPTTLPSSSPSATPSSSSSPVSVPSLPPATRPSSSPSALSTLSPSTSAPPSMHLTSLPSSSSSAAPSSCPTSSPSSVPLARPTMLPSSLPSVMPTPCEPSLPPTTSPSSSPIAAPSSSPSSSPTLVPSGPPTMYPSTLPSALPTIIPSASPTSAPSQPPTTSPSSSPSALSSSCPTSSPTYAPSVLPTMPPSSSPSALPTNYPSSSPTSVPSMPPMASPSSSSSALSSSCPTSSPTYAPSVLPTMPPSSSPSVLPTNYPSSSPTSVPSMPPMTSPSSSSSAAPSICPSSSPASVPSLIPTTLPSSSPSALSTKSPSASPTSVPSVPPTTLSSSSSSAAPSSCPTSSPSSLPSACPTTLPSSLPSAMPTPCPSVLPAFEPSLPPTTSPSSSPISEPSSNPSSSPSFVPSVPPTMYPSSLPSTLPTIIPSASSTSAPSLPPTTLPSSSPSALSSSCPTASPTTAPSVPPTTLPSTSPSVLPTSSYPSLSPTSVPSVPPTTLPSTAPSALPTTSPSGSPTSVPSAPPTPLPSSAPNPPPTSYPSSSPTSVPTFAHSTLPSSLPSAAPSRYPSLSPTSMPSVHPTTLPSNSPSALTMVYPSASPISEPSLPPTTMPLSSPSVAPTNYPSSSPTSLPLVPPAPLPSNAAPTLYPSSSPISEPSVHPTTPPSSWPSAPPTIRPSSSPVSEPSLPPTTWPFSSPSVPPKISPSTLPASEPSQHPTTSPSSSLGALPKTTQSSALPSFAPSLPPTTSPFSSPSGPPTVCPSKSPTFKQNPTTSPSNLPSTPPTTCPFLSPSFAPSLSPIASPLVMAFPSTAPTQPTIFPTIPSNSTQRPASAPSPLPTPGTSTWAPSNLPSRLSLSPPSQLPTSYPSLRAPKSANNPTALSTLALPTPAPSSTNVTLGIGSLVVLGNLRASEFGEVESAFFSSAIIGFTDGADDVIDIRAQDRTFRLRARGRRLQQVESFIDVSFVVLFKAVETTERIALVSGVKAQLSTAVTTSLANSSSSPLQDSLRAAVAAANDQTSPLVDAVVDEDASLATIAAETRVDFIETPGVPTPQPTIKVSLPSAFPSSAPTASPTKVSCEKLNITDPPKLVSAQFSSSGAILHIGFDSSTNRGGRVSGVEFACDEVFDFAGVEATTCTWVNTTTADAVVSDAPSFVPGSNVTLRDGVVEAACVDDERCECYEPANGTTVRAMTPVDAVVPRVVFQGPASISVCDNFTLVADQSTGSAGREMMFFWSAAAAANSATLSAAVERAQGSAYFVLSYSELEEFIAVRSRLELTLSLTNFLEVTTTASYSLRLTYSQIPSLVIVGGADIALASRSEALSIEAEGFATACDGRPDSERQVDFSWTLFEVQPDDGSLLLRTGYESTANNERFFKLDAFAQALASNTSYVLRVTVIDQIISGLNTTQDVSIDVGVGQVVAAIDGGARQSASNLENITLSAAESYDEDDPVGTLAFRWQCVSEDTSLCDDDDDDDDVPVTSNPVLSLAAGSLVPGTYTFTVEISTEDGRTAEAQTILTVAATPIPRVDIAFFDAVVSAADKLTIEASVALTTEGAADAGQDVVSTWSLTSGDLAGDRSLENVARTPLSVSKGLDGNLSRSHPLVITPSALVPGGVYTFELDAIFEGNRGYASVSVVVVEPPTSGGLDVNPTTGFALYTIFRLLAEGWVSAEPPLQYRFETERGMLRTSSPDTVLDNTRFPIGFAPPILEVTVVVTDALRSTASASRNVNVTVFNTTLLVDDVNDALTTGFAKYSLSEVCQVVAATAGLLDDDNDDDDEVLATIVSALVSAVEEFVDPELEELELSIESSRALTENHLDDASAQEVLDVLNGLTSKLARIGLGVSGNTTAQDSVAEALSNLLTMGLFSTITEESESSRRRRQLEEGVSSSNLLLQTVDLLTLAQRETLVENEDAVGSRASNLRTASKIVSNQLTDGVQEVGIAGMNASSSIVPDDGSVYAISLTEFLVNPHEVEEEGDNNKALSQVVRFDLNVSSTISERFADDDGAALLNTANTRFTDVTLRIPGQVFLNRTPAIAVTAECECGFVGFKEVECPDATVSLFCDGLAPGVFNYTCNSTSLACATWDALTRRWVLPPSCETVQDEEDSTRCDCRVDNRDEPRDYSTRREVSNSAEEFTRVFETKPNIHKSRLVLAMCLGLVVATIVAAVLGEQLDRRGSEGKEDRDVRGSEEFSMRTRSTSFSFFNTPATRALARRQIEHVPGLSAGGVIESLRKHHPMLNWYYVYDAEMPRKWRALKLGVESALIFLALALEVAWIEFPSINCGAYDETKCEVEAKSLVSRKPLCKFDECSASCVEKSTTEAAATVEHFVLLALVVAVILPLLTFLDWLIDGIIAAPVPPALMPAWLCCESSSSSSSWPHFSPSSIAGGGPPAHETSDDAAQKTVRDESPDDDDDDDDSVLQVLNNEEDAPPPPPPPQVKVEATFEEEEEEVTAADHSGEGGSRAPREHVAIAWGDNLAATIRQVQDDDFDLDECFVSTVDDDDDNNGSKMLVVFDDAKNNNSPEEEEEEDGAKDELPRRSGDSTIIDKEDDERPRPSSTLIALPSGGPPDSIWPQFIARCHASLGSRRSGAGLTSVERKKNDERTSGKSFGSRASRRVSFGLESLWNRSLAGSQPQQNNTEEVDMRGLAAEVVQNMRLGFLELETCRSYAESNEHVREVAMISEIEERFRREWHWVRDEDAWRANVLEMVRGHVQAAWRLWNDMENIRGDNASEALERMVDVERASRLSFVERRIYDTIRRQNQKPSPSPAAYVSAWLGLLVIMVGAVIVMMQVATSIGYDRTRLWVMGVLVDFVLIFVVLIPLGILIFDVALPLLIADRLRLLDDPTAIRTFPFKANVPSSPIFFFCQLEPAYAATRLGRFALGRVARKSRDSYRLSGVGDLDFDDAFLFDELPGIYEDMTWSPSPTVRAALRLCVGIIALPDGLRKPVFEELVLWFATLGTVAVSILLRRATLRYQDRFGELYFLLVAILSAVLGVLLGRIFVRFRAVLHGITTTTASTSFIT